MSSQIPWILTVYLGLIFNFYCFTEGFEGVHDWTYSVLKMMPVTFLGLAVFYEYSSLTGSQARCHALGLLLGAVGDYLIASHRDGLYSGAIVFGIGHLFYMNNFAMGMKKLCKPFAVGILVYGAVMGHLFIKPLLSTSPVSAIVLIIYSLVESSAFVISGSIYFYGSDVRPAKQQNALMRFIGFGVFVVSDSILLLCHMNALAKFHELAILTTYFTSQYLILMGATQQMV